MLYRVRVTSKLRVEPSALWAHASSMEGINEELAPVRMSYPKGATLDASVPLGVPLFRSVLTLFRLLPLDVHTLILARVDPGRGFLETSRSLLERQWRHERTIESAEAGSTLTDEVTFEPRILGAVVAKIVPRLFARRHAILRRKFGSADDAPIRVDVSKMIIG